jgi:hypothetical protein
MRTGIVIAVWSLMAMPVQAQGHSTVPEQFQGTWASSQAKCGVASESSLSIHADSVDFYASRNRVLRVQIVSNLEVEMQLESLGGGEGHGQVYRSTRRFRLSEDQLSLTDVTRSDHQAVRVRCK